MSDVNKDFTIKNGILEKYKGKSAEVIVPDGVTVVGEEAFSRLSASLRPFEAWFCRRA